MNTLDKPKVAPIPEVFSAAHLCDLIPGQRFKTEGLFQGVCDECVKWKTLTVDRGVKANRYTLEATYFGVSLGEFDVEVSNKGKVKINGPK